MTNIALISATDAGLLMNRDPTRVRKLVKEGIIKGDYMEGKKKDSVNIFRYHFYDYLGITDKQAEEILLQKKSLRDRVSD